MDAILRFTGHDLEELTVTEWLETKPDALHAIASEWIEAMEKSGPGTQLIFHDGYPIACVESAPFAYVNAYSQHVNLGFFYGVDLPDEHGLLEGTGKRMRHTKIRPEQMPDRSQLLSLLAKAYEDIKMRLSELPQL